jgi:hypothetical protein
VETAEREVEARPGHARAEASETLPVAATLALAALASAAFAQGAYYFVGQVLAGTLLLAAAVAGRTSERGAPGRVARSFPPAKACGALGIICVLSAAAAGHPASSRAPVLLLIGCVLVTHLFRTSAGAHGDGLAWGLIVLGVILGLTGWLGLALRIQPWALEDGPLWRASTTLTYANAAAGLLAPLALLALGRLARRPTSVSGAVCASLILVSLGATVSRGGAVALAAGLVYLGARVGWAPLVRAIGGAVLGAAVALAALVPSVPTDRPAQSALALGGLVAGLAISIAWAKRTPGTGSVRPMWAGGLVVALALGGVASAGALGAIVQAGRFKPTSADRVEEARAALRVGVDHPVLGAGPGRASFAWRQADGTFLAARYAHNEYLQVFAELGIVGLAALLALALSVVHSIRRATGAHLADAGRAGAGAVAGLLAFGVHSGMDFLWHVPAIPLVAAALVGLACPFTRKELT